MTTTKIRHACKLCHRPVLWTVNERSGARLPIDPAPAVGGNVRIIGAGPPPCRQGSRQGRARHPRPVRRHRRRGALHQAHRHLPRGARVVIDPLHPLRDVIDRHWPIAPTNDPAAADVRRRTIEDLIVDLDTYTVNGCSCSCSCEACEECEGDHW